MEAVQNDLACALVAVSETEALAVLMRSEISLWRAVAWAKSRAAEVDDEWFIADLRDMSRAAGIAYGTAINSLAGLRRCGLLATSPSYELLGASRGGHAVRRDRNWYFFPGRVEGEIMWLPKTSWETLVERCRVPTLAARLSLRAGLKPLAKPPRPRWLRRPGESSNSLKPINGVSSLTSLKEMERKSDVVSERAAPARAQTRFSCSASRERDPLEAVLLELMNDRTEYPPPKNITPGYVHHSRPVEPLTRPPAADVGWIPSGVLPQVRAEHVARGYRDACLAVYGTRSYAYSSLDYGRARELADSKAKPSSKSESKLITSYKRLLAIGSEMYDRSVPPKHWFIWQMRWYRERDARYRDRPPPVFMIASAGMVAKRAGFFKHTYDLKSVVYGITAFVASPVRREQQYRNHEGALRMRGLGEKLIWANLPHWYYEKRQLEILFGDIDPMKRFPASRRVA